MTAAEALLWLLEKADRVSGCGCPCAVYEIRIVDAEVARLRDLATKERARETKEA
jgi:hypothetical protein